jgi:sec-independent protein translocase protein TatC
VRRHGPIPHDQHLTLVEHLEELRSRIVVSLAAFGVALALCFWQSDLLLQLASAPLPAGHDRLITFGVTEPFTTTLTVSAYGALILALPVVIYQAYAYLLPAFAERERQAIAPLLALVPTLFLAGVAFGYFVVLPAATRFLLNFNDAQFNVQVRASDYYGFFGMTLVGCGLIFQVPLALLAATRLGMVEVRQLRRNRRYAYLGCAVVAAALPGVDPITMLIEMVPLILLYEIGILLARAFGEPSSAGAETVGAAAS